MHREGEGAELGLDSSFFFPAARVKPALGVNELQLREEPFMPA